MVRLCSPTMVRQAHQPWFDRLTNRGSTGLGRDFSLAGFPLPRQGIPSRGRRVSACRSILLLQSFKKSMDGFFSGRIFSSSPRNIEPGWRVSACRNILLLQSFKKSKDGFFSGRISSSLPRNTEPRKAG